MANQDLEKCVYVLKPWGNANENYVDISSQDNQTGQYQGDKDNAGEVVEGGALFTVSGAGTHSPMESACKFFNTKTEPPHDPSVPFLADTKGPPGRAPQ